MLLILVLAALFGVCWLWLNAVREWWERDGPLAGSLRNHFRFKPMLLECEPRVVPAAKSCGSLPGQTTWCGAIKTHGLTIKAIRKLQRSTVSSTSTPTPARLVACR